MTATEPTTEEALWMAIGVNPADSLVRLVFADWLEENAGAVKCKRCDGCDGGGCPYCGGDEADYHFTCIECPSCSGTGVVPDGRADTAAGLRATSGKVPWQWPYGENWRWSKRSQYEYIGDDVQDDELPDDLWESLPNIYTPGSANCPAARWFPTALAAIRGLVSAWVKVKTEQRGDVK